MMSSVTVSEVRRSCARAAARYTPGLPALPTLMHATQVSRPFHTKGWVYEDFRPRGESVWSSMEERGFYKP
jgi:hypothetical protein